MNREYELKRYVLAGVVTLLVFLLGTALGLVAEGMRKDYLSAHYMQTSTEYESLQLQYLFISLQADDKEGCSSVQYAFTQYIKDLEKKREELESYLEDSSVLGKAQFSNLERQYVLAEVKAWILARRISEQCNGNSQATLLFFHSKDCPECDKQAIVLDYLKRNFNENLLIFTFRGDHYEEPMVDILLHHFNITTYPSIVLEEEVHHGPIVKNRLLALLCTHFGPGTNGCE
jgi:hypothetical protein